MFLLNESVFSIDLYLTFSDGPLQTDHILISDIGLSDDTALICQNRQATHEIFNWFHKLKVRTKIFSNGHNIGWQSKNAVSNMRSYLILTRKRDPPATEGILTCQTENKKCVVSVEVHYPSE